MGGGPSKRWVLGLEPSGAGISGGMVVLLLSDVAITKLSVRRSGRGTGPRTHPVERRRRPRRRSVAVYLVDDRHPGGHPTEEGVARGEALALRPGDDEELAAVGGVG